MDFAFEVGSGFNSTVYSLSPAIDGSGDVYVGGSFTSYKGTTSNHIIRLNSDGRKNNAFAVGSGFDGDVRSLRPATDGSGDVYVGGSFTSYNGTASSHIIRLNSDGTVDTTFFVGSGFDDSVSSLSPATDGSGDIYVGGSFTSYKGTASNKVIRLNSDGKVDIVFAVGSGFSNAVRSLSPATDGSGDIYVGGFFTSYNGTASNRLIRLNSDGSVDNAFAVGSGFNSTVYSLSPAIDGSGDIYIGGSFTRYNSTGSNRLIRLNSDGTVDNAFGLGSGFSRGTVWSLSPAIDDSGDIFIGGTFDSYQAITVDRIVRLNPDGSLN